MKNYVSLEEIMNIYSLSPNTVGVILRKYKIDTFRGKKGMLVNLHDFHKVYTSKFNPTLFSFEERKKEKVKKEKDEVIRNIKFGDSNSFLVGIFSNPMFSYR